MKEIYFAFILLLNPALCALQQLQKLRNVGARRNPVVVRTSTGRNGQPQPTHTETFPSEDPFSELDFGYSETLQTPDTSSNLRNWKTPVDFVFKPDSWFQNDIVVGKGNTNFGSAEVKRPEDFSDLSFPISFSVPVAGATPLNMSPEGYLDLINQLKSEAARTSEELELHKEHLEQQKSFSDQFNESALNARKEVAAKQVEVEELNKQISSNQTLTQKLQESIAKTEASLEMAKREVEAGKLETQQLRDEHKKTLEALEEENNKLGERADDLDKKLANKSTELAFAQKQSELQASLAEESHKRLEEEKASFAKRLEQNQVELEKKQTELENLTAELEKAASKDTELSSQMKSITVELQQAKDLVTQQSDAVLKAQEATEALAQEKKDLELKAAEQEKNLVESEAKVIKLNLAVQESKDQIDQIKQQVQSTEQNNRKLAEQVKNFEADNKTLEQEARKAVELQKEVESLNEKLRIEAAEYQDKLQKGQDQIAAIQEKAGTDVGVLKAEVQKVTTEMEALRSSHALSIEEAAKKLLDLGVELNSAKLEIDLLKLKNSEEVRSSVSSSARVRELEAQLEKEQQNAKTGLDMAHEKTRLMIEASSKMVESQSSSLEALRIENERLKSEYEEKIANAAFDAEILQLGFDAELLGLKNQLENQAKSLKIGQDQLQSVKTINDDLQQTLQNALTILDKSAFNIEVLGIDLGHAQAESQTLKEQQAQLQTQFDDLERQHQDAVKAQQETASKLAEWKVLNAIAGTAETAEAGEVANAITAKLNAKDDAITKLSGEIEAKTAEYSEAEARLQKLGTEYDQIRLSVEGALDPVVESGKSIVEKIEVLKNTLASEIAAKEEKIVELKAAAVKTAETEGQVDALTKELDALKETENKLGKTVEKLTNDLQVEKDVRAQESAELRKQLQDIGAERDSLTNALETLRTEKSKLESEMKKSQEDLEEVNFHFKQATEASSKNAEDLRLERVELESRATRVKELQQKLQEAEQNLASKELQFQNMIKEKDVNATEADRLQKAILAEKSNLSVLEGQLDAADVLAATQGEKIRILEAHEMTLKSQITKLSETTGRLELEVSDYQKSIEKLGSDIEARDAKIKQSELEIVSLKEQIAQNKLELQKQGEAHIHAVNKLQADLAQAEAEIDSLEDKYHEHVNSLRADISFWEKELTKTEETLKDQQAQQAKLGEELKSVKTELGLKGAEIKQKDGEIVGLKTEKEQLREDFLKAKAEHTEATKKINEKLAAKSAAKKQLKAELKERQKEAKALTLQMKTMQRDNKKAELEKMLKKTAKSLAGQKETAEALQKFLGHLKEYKGTKEADLNELKRLYREDIPQKNRTPEIKQIWKDYKASAREVFKLTEAIEGAEIDFVARIQKLEAEKEALQDKLDIQQREMAEFNQVKKDAEAEVQKMIDDTKNVTTTLIATVGKLEGQAAVKVAIPEVADPVVTQAQKDFEAHRQAMARLIQDMELLSAKNKVVEENPDVPQTIADVGKVVDQAAEQINKTKALEAQLKQTVEDIQKQESAGDKPYVHIPFGVGHGANADGKGAQAGDLGADGAAQPQVPDVIGGQPGGSPGGPKGPNGGNDGGNKGPDGEPKVGPDGGEKGPEDNTGLEPVLEGVEKGDGGRGKPFIVLGTLGALAALEILRRLLELLNEDESILQQALAALNGNLGTLQTANSKLIRNRLALPSLVIKLKSDNFKLEEELKELRGEDLKLTMPVLTVKNCDEELKRERSKNLELMKLLAQRTKDANEMRKNLMNGITQNNTTQQQNIINPPQIVNAAPPSEDDDITVILQQCPEVCAAAPRVLANLGETASSQTSGSEIVAWVLVGLLGTAVVGAGAWYWFVLRAPAAV